MNLLWNNTSFIMKHNHVQLCTGNKYMYCMYSCAWSMQELVCQPNTQYHHMQCTKEEVTVVWHSSPANSLTLLPMCDHIFCLHYHHCSSEIQLVISGLSATIIAHSPLPSLLHILCVLCRGVLNKSIHSQSEIASIINSHKRLFIVLIQTRLDSVTFPINLL